MKLKELQEWINKNLFKKNSEINASKISGKAKWIENNNLDAKESIIYYTSFLPETASFSRRIWHIFNNVFYIPKCDYCDKEVDYIKFNRGYKKFCSHHCMSLKGKEKVKKKYNVDSPLQIKEFCDKVKKTKEKNHGNPNFTNRKKAEQTCLNKYGVKNISQVPEIREKIEQTNLERYNTKYPLLSEEIKRKSLNTLKEKYGLEEDITNPFQIEDVKEKSRNTNFYKNGIEHNSQRNIKNINNLNRGFVKNNFIDNRGRFNLKEFQEHFNMSYSHSYIKLKELGIDYNRHTSRDEEDLYNYITSLTNDKVINKDKSLIYPWEIDILIPNKNLAIEYNGLYWHSELVNNDKNYHLKKTKICENKETQLIHIFENNWKDYLKRDIIKSMISEKLGVNEKIFARNTTIREVENKEKNDFLNENHLQGQCLSSINIGLFYNDKLVSLITFSKPRFNKNYNWELIRFCNLKYTSVVGGASKLLNYFYKNYNGSIITYADRTYSNGSLYKKLGFVKIKENKPRYYYFKNGKVINRMKAQKKNLSQLLENYNPNLTEWENMRNNGYNRFWDCGTITYIYKR